MELPRSDVNGSMWRPYHHHNARAGIRGFRYRVRGTRTGARHAELRCRRHGHSALLAEPRTELKLRSAATKQPTEEGRPIYCSAACQALGTT